MSSCEDAGHVFGFMEVFTDQRVSRQGGALDPMGAGTRQKSLDEAVSVTATRQTCNQGVK